MEALSKSEMEALGRDCIPHMEELKKTGHLVTDNGLNWDTTTIRPRNGKASVTDGPFTESKEQVGGVFIVEAKDRDEAILTASKHPAGRLGEHLGWGIEVRPIAFSDEGRGANGGAGSKRYLCLVYDDRSRMGTQSKADMAALQKEAMPRVEELKKSGHMLSAAGLSWETTIIRPRNGTASVTDGPFTETKEQIGGTFIIEARDLNEAILVASKHPAAHLGENVGWGIEVRPIASEG